MKLDQLQEGLFGKKIGDVIINGKSVRDLETCNDLVVYNDAITSLKGCPKEIKGDLICFGNKIASLKGCPEKIGKNFDCSRNNLTSFKYGPTEVGGDLIIYNNAITSLKGCPEKIGGIFDCSYNKLTSLEGCPKEINGSFNCSQNMITSLQFGPSKVRGKYKCVKNKLTNLHDIFKLIVSCTSLSFVGNPIKSHILGLLKIENLEEVFLDNEEVEEIINKYLPLGDIFDCQEELIEAGFEEYAKL
jgi:hypothetical protein